MRRKDRLERDGSREVADDHPAAAHEQAGVAGLPYRAFERRGRAFRCDPFSSGDSCRSLGQLQSAGTLVHGARDAASRVGELDAVSSDHVQVCSVAGDDDERSPAGVGATSDGGESPRRSVQGSCR